MIQKRRVGGGVMICKEGNSLRLCFTLGRGVYLFILNFYCLIWECFSAYCFSLSSERMQVQDALMWVIYFFFRLDDILI